MIDIDKKYRTRNGNDVRLYDILPFGCHENNRKVRVVGAILISSGWVPALWDADGVEMGRPFGMPGFDLVEVDKFTILSADDVSVKSFDYFGVDISVLSNTKYIQYNYIATDADGRVYIYRSMPVIDDMMKIFKMSEEGTAFCPYMVRQVNHRGDWKQSLKEIVWV